MRLLQICYDLNGFESGYDYKRLISAIYSLGTVEKAQYSVWFLRTNKTHAQVRDYLNQFIDSNDSLLITEVTAIATNLNVPSSVVSLANQTWNPKPVLPSFPRALPKMNQPYGNLSSLYRNT
ncbi:hypothetical protein [Paenibacillus sp. Root444D2]|uniref:hypothetical protein n=1 Tax=Paenibacillus sp. Root444D2 TaxID=1736538 RepID=UPI00070A0D71|nr:hypothetical protein [Paenibacillus sp. Root444D2]KQX69243.1 hypothetical protein ASD40_01715 [Paenibacillus sp. Root444D2]